MKLKAQPVMHIRSIPETLHIDSDVSCDACGQSAIDGVLGTYGVFCEACVKPKTKMN